jgi:prepilin-type N-terminal cleavage/methylation domain-containing protein
MVARTYRGRTAFTLIELLVVMSIIAVLASLLMAAVMKVRSIGKETAAKSEIRQLDVSINAYVANRGTHLPSFGHIDPTNPAVNPNRYFRLLPKYDGSLGLVQNAPTDTTCFEWQYLNRIFPGLSPSATGLPALNLDCNQTMIFFLTGGPVTNYTGFSNDARFPFDTTNLSNRKGKFFDIPDNRINNGHYLDPWGTAYMYFAPYDGKQYPAPPSAASDVIPQPVLQAFITDPNVVQPTGINPFLSLLSAGPPAKFKAIKDNSFQIISAGPNKIFGRGGFFVTAGNYSAYVAGQSPYGPQDPGGDDFSNFNNLKLSAPNN